MRAKELRRVLRCRVATVLPGVLGRVPAGPARAFCAGMGVWALRTIPRDRRRAHRNLSLVFPKASSREIASMARMGMMELGKNVCDFLRYPRLSRDEREALVKVEGLEKLRAITREGRGAVVVSGHLGCWELIGAGLQGKGLCIRGLVRPLREKRLNRLLEQHRKAMGIGTIDSTAPLAAVRHVRSGGVLIILIDQRVPRGLWVDFLGQRTLITDAAARIALLTGSPLVPVTITREGKRHRLRVGNPIAPPEHSSQVQRVTQELVRPLERRILAHPDQWMWIHPRWEGEVRSPVPVGFHPNMESVA